MNKEVFFYNITHVSILNIVLIITVFVISYLVIKKKGEKKWKVFIPFYNIYLLYKILWEPKIFWITLSLYSLGLILSEIFHIISYSNIVLTAVIGIINILCFWAIIPFIIILIVKIVKYLKK